MGDIEPLNWWESKRLIYNLALLGGAFLAYLIISTSSRELSFMSLLVWLFGANVFYTMSWAFELLFYKFFKRYPFNKASRKVIFVLGTLFSIWWTNIGLQSWSNF
jgi:hypothetical protein